MNNGNSGRTAQYAFTIFVSAFLLFQVQPIVAKMILPWFGGSSAVWSTCMLFFQMALLAGYSYAHWLNGLGGGKRPAYIHAGLLLVSLIALPIGPGAMWKPSDVSNPSLRILTLLAATIGPPYFMLSSTSPLLQSWYARETGKVPYRLFALSNLASMLALITYPVLIEPNLSVHTQSIVWSVGYVLFGAVCIFTAFRAAAVPVPAYHHEEQVHEAVASGFASGFGLKLLWLGLAATASSMLLAVTNYLTQDVAAIPFLWVLPLALYLLTFIICFDSPRIYHRAVFIPLLIASLGAFGYLLLSNHAIALNMKATIAIASAAMFVCCMVCHGELARLKPAAHGVTGFYVMVSVGGAVGGLFVGLFAPNVFTAYWEFPITLTACALLVTTVIFRAYRQWFSTGFVGRGAAVVMMVALGAYSSYILLAERRATEGYRKVARNFYGELRVEDEGKPGEPDADRMLLHGRINHGTQMLNEQFRRKPVSYFCPPSGIGVAMNSRPAGQPSHVGILGLGAGALAAYGRSGDTFSIYEINPLVLDFARSEFTYLSDTPAKTDVTLGDGRLSLENQPSRQFDILVMDAFSGDSVPVHLLTAEAFQIYYRHLKPDGMLIVNISNRYLDLEPVIERAASHFGKKVIVVDHDAEDDDPNYCSSSSFALIMNRDQDIPDAHKEGHVLNPHQTFRMWTDDFSNMFSILK